MSLTGHDTGVNRTDLLHARESHPWEIVSGTGHRDLGGADPCWVRAQLARCVAWLRDQRGCRVGITGMARGFDLLWGQALADAGLEVWAYLPFEEQAAMWNRADRAAWAALRAVANRRAERVLGTLPAGAAPRDRSRLVNGLLAARNTAMLEDSGAVVALWATGRFDGGTHKALTVAAKRRMPGVHLNPATQAIAFELPTLAALTPCALYHGVCGCVAGIGTRAEVEERQTTLTALGFSGWRMRPARPRETWGEGCDTCRVPTHSPSR